MNLASMSKGYADISVSHRQGEDHPYKRIAGGFNDADSAHAYIRNCREPLSRGDFVVIVTRATLEQQRVYAEILRA